MAEQDLIAVARAAIEAFNASDWQGFRAAATPGVVYEETGSGRRVEGIDAYLQLGQGWKEAFPDVKGTILSEIVSGDTVAQELLWEGTHTGTLVIPGATIPASGKPFRAKAVMWSRFQGAEIAVAHHYLDVLALLAQIGALPTP